MVRLLICVYGFMMSVISVLAMLTLLVNRTLPFFYDKSQGCKLVDILTVFLFVQEVKQRVGSENYL